MIKLASALVLAATLVVPVAAYAASDPSKDATSNVDHKTETKDGKASPGTVGAMDHGVESGSFTASKAAQGKDLTKTK